MVPSSVWSTPHSHSDHQPNHGGVGGGMGGMGGGGPPPMPSTTTTTISTPSPTDLLNIQLASALNTMGDSQFYEESIAPSTIRQSLSSADPSNPSSTSTLLRGMKWLLACMSKGRDVSDFYPHVVKLVTAPSLEVRKMVYVYLVQYADHNAETRELSLLSINSFQRALSDSEQLIRALALRVLSSIRIADILQIQILAVKRCSCDKSPYVRKCAANALAKLAPRCDELQKQTLLEIVKTLLDEDTSTMVLTSTIIAFAELCPYRLDLLHGSYRKICHLLTDMDEWGQVVVIDTLARYCRQYFREPHAMKEGSAEVIDRERRVRRTVDGIEGGESITNGLLEEDKRNSQSIVAMNDGNKDLKTLGGGGQLAERGSAGPRKFKRRVVRKAFYSDEEDESSEEEIYAAHPHGTPLTVASAMRQRDVLGLGGGKGIAGDGGGSSGVWNFPAAGGSRAGGNGEEDEDLHEDHRLLLRSSLPLLKSRNAGVVLAVCSLHYYCGVSSIKIRSSLGKALVRIHRDRREIQYVVLTSIRSLVTECPSAFTPFLSDFFVTAMDPSFTRMIKLDILTSLALDPASIEAVLKELRTYIRHDDKVFVLASIRAVGKVAELARIVYDRHGKKNGIPAQARADANVVALNCLYGLLTLTECSENDSIVGEGVMVMQRIMLQLMSGSGGAGGTMQVEDPNFVQSMALRRLVLLLVRSLASSRGEGGDENNNDLDEGSEWGELTARTVVLPPPAVASALWIVGELFAPTFASPIKLYNTDENFKPKMRSELLRLLARSFPDMDQCVKLQAVHFASKVLLSTKDSSSFKKHDVEEAGVCEHIFSMGRVDVNQDVRDRARYESNVLHMSVGLVHDTDALSTLPSDHINKLAIANAKEMLFGRKPPSSSLPLEDSEEARKNNDEITTFRFGTLSNLLSHRAGGAYLPVPPWSDKDSPGSLRDPSALQQKAEARDVDGWKVEKKTGASFYDSDDESSSTEEESSSSEEESSTSSSGSADEESTSSDEESSEDEESSNESAEESEEDSPPASGNVQLAIFANGGVQKAPPVKSATKQESSDDDDSSDETNSNDNSSYSSGEEHSLKKQGGGGSSATTGSLLNMAISSQPLAYKGKALATQTSSASSLAEGLEGLVMAPLVVDNDGANDGKADVEKDSSAWKKLVRHELGGGLSANARYFRGPTREREAKLMGLDPKSVTTVCLQIKFENRRTDAGTLRRVRIVQRGGSSHGTVAPRRVVIPQEISALKKGQMSVVTLGIDFASASDRDGALLAKFDFKSDRGSNSVEIRPPLGELLQACRMNRSDFDANVERLHGIHQRVISSFTLEAGEDETIRDLHKALPLVLRKHANLTQVKGETGWKDNQLRFVGTLPASRETLCVVVKCNPQSGSGEIMVCSDDTLASNSVIDLLKRTVTGNGTA